ncbi:prepilin peptidase [Candidatus Woesearchaeota archaeon]|jgi:Flp pilus assembly protein protease CpaA|nr:prepilin peptidase [Candidatus Woesearchaeota archaeon]
MIFEVFAYSLIFLALIVGSYSDFKIREVADWISYGLVFAGLGLRIIFSLITSNPWFIYEGLIGFTVLLAFALIMFYTGQWGGGDSKILIAMGAVIGIKLTTTTFLIGFFINLVIFGAIYGFGYSLYLVYKHKDRFKEAFIQIIKDQKIEQIIFGGVALLVGITAFLVPKEYLIGLIGISILIITSYFAIAYLKAVELSAMIKEVSPEKLTEGDWIVDDVIVNKKIICGPKDLGIEQHQIDTLIALKKKKKINLITIKEGIPFIPSFLLAFISTYFWGNWLFIYLQIL